jgi:hypothetical protein
MCCIEQLQHNTPGRLGSLPVAKAGSIAGRITDAARAAKVARFVISTGAGEPVWLCCAEHLVILECFSERFTHDLCETEGLEKQRWAMSNAAELDI